jgi:hypothetical protein
LGGKQKQKQKQNKKTKQQQQQKEQTLVTKALSVHSIMHTIFLDCILFDSALRIRSSEAKVISTFSRHTSPSGWSCE